MKLRYLIGALIAPLCAQADFEPGPYYAVKAGIMRTSISGHDPAFNVGGVLGYHAGDAANGYVSIEGEITAALVNSDARGGGEWSADTLGVFGTYRSLGDTYLKTKAGFVVQNINGGDVPDGSGLGFGFGVGFSTANNTALEVEYTILDDLGFLSLGFVSRF
jgi:hypothetical protein